MINLMVEGEEGYEIKIFRKNSHSIWENYLSGDQIINWFGENLFGFTMM